MRHIRLETRITAPPDIVFKVVADPYKSFLTSNPLTRMELGSDRSQGLGTVYRWRFRVPFGFRLPGLTFRFAEIVTQWQPGRRFAYRALTGWRMRAATELTAVDGGTRLTFTLEYLFSPPWSFLIPQQVVVLGCTLAVRSVKRQAEELVSRAACVGVRA